MSDEYGTKFADITNEIHPSTIRAHYLAIPNLEIEAYYWAHLAFSKIECGLHPT